MKDKHTHMEYGEMLDSIHETLEQADWSFVLSSNGNTMRIQQLVAPGETADPDLAIASLMRHIWGVIHDSP